MKTEEIKLLHCPLCGGKAQFSSCVDYDAIFCTGCGIRTRENRGSYDPTSNKRKLETAALWNTRDTSSAMGIKEPAKK